MTRHCDDVGFRCPRPSRIDGSVYASEAKADYLETTLIDLTADEGPTRELTVPGFLQNIARIR